MTSDEELKMRFDLFQNTYVKAVSFMKPIGILKLNKQISEKEKAELIEQFKNSVHTSPMVLPQEAEFELITQPDPFPHNFPALEMAACLLEDEVFVQKKFENVFPVLREYNDEYVVIRKKHLELFYQQPNQGL